MVYISVFLAVAKCYIMKLKLIILSVLFAGCAVQNGNFATSSTSLQPGSFRVVRTAQGHASVEYILGIGGFRSKGLAYEAKQSLLDSAKLQPNQCLANVSVDNRQTLLLPFYYRHTLMLTADVVEAYASGESDNVFDSNVIYRASGNASDTLKNSTATTPVVNLAGYRVGERIKIPRGLKTIEGIIVQVKPRSVIAQYQTNGKTKTVEIENYLVEKY
jgi:hypothetical protein